MAQYDKLINAMAETLSENQEVKYAKFLIKTITLPDGRLAEFSYRLEPIEDDKINTPTPYTTNGQLRTLKNVRLNGSIGGNNKMKEHLQLPFIGEFSMGYPYNCKICGEDLRTEKSAKTNGQEWYFTRNGKRHYKTRCNIKNEVK